MWLDQKKFRSYLKNGSQMDAFAMALQNYGELHLSNCETSWTFAHQIRIKDLEITSKHYFRAAIDDKYKKPEMPKRKSNSVIVCCGGGADSTALLQYYTELGYDVQGIHFDYGQIPFPGESKAVEAISAHYKTPIFTSVLRPKLTPESNREYKGRNALFVLFAAQFLEDYQGLIGLGIHTGTTYYDCSPMFVRHMQQILGNYYHGTVVLDAPFLDFHKRDIYAYCKAKDVPVALTYSCQSHPHIPCGICPSCRDRRHYDSSL